MSGELAALSLACGLSFATVCYQSNGPQVCCGQGFHLSANGSTVIQQGTTEEIDVFIDRNADFDPTLRLQVAAPRGIHSSLSSKRMSRGQDGQVRLTIAVDADAPIGCRVVTVAAYSDFRQVVSIPVRVWVSGANERLAR